MGKEHHAGRPSWVPAFLVVVSILSVFCLFIILKGIVDPFFKPNVYARNRLKFMLFSENLLPHTAVKLYGSLLLQMFFVYSIEAKLVEVLNDTKMSK